MNIYIKGLKFESPHPSRTEADRLKKKFKESATVDGNGIVRWKSGNVPPDDILVFWNYLGYDFDLTASREAHQKDLDRILKQYRENYKGPSPELQAEAWAAHGPGVTMVDVITGHKWTT